VWLAGEAARLAPRGGSQTPRMIGADPDLRSPPRG
jgi:hypothetical protein